MTAKLFGIISAQLKARRARHEVLIDEYLAHLSRTRVVVRNSKELADLVAMHISQAEGKPFNRCSLTRNTAYKDRLLAYRMVNIPTKKLRVVDSNESL